MLDLQTENLLLRAEIKRHKTLVDHLKSITERESAHSTIEKHIMASQVIIRYAHITSLTSSLDG